MADRLVNGTTPLEAAETPNMDKLAKEGICGIMDTVAAGIRPGSDTAHLSLLGYDPYKVYTGRGPLEAEGAGIKLEKGDVAIRCNFASVIDGKVVDRRAGREEYGLEELAKEIDGMEIEINHNCERENYEELVIYTDGASSGNPGPAGIGIVIRDRNGNLIKEHGEYIGEATNNVSEYKAIIKALEMAKELGAEKLKINSDSNLIVNQIRGKYKINESHLKKLCCEVMDLQQQSGFGNVFYNLIPREENQDADKLAKRASENKQVDSSKNKVGNKIKVIFKKSSGHRCVVVFRGRGLSASISDSDPEKEGVPVNDSKPLDDTPEAKFTAEILNKFTEKSSEILNNHNINKERTAAGKLPANALLARGTGIRKDIESFEERYGFRGAAIAGVDLIKGVCRTAGLDVIEVSGATGHVDSNIRGKALAAVWALKDYDFVLLHIKGTDEASHDGVFEKKREMIEKIDKDVIGTILENCDMKNLNLILTADHTTPISLKKHTADPVPVLIHGDVRTDLVENFGERSCARGDLGRICGKDLLNILFDLSDRKGLFGA
jgi:2,3-diphosphopglycerate-independent phosphoglycerate mutase